MWPISVCIPVAVTTSSPRPRVTEVFMYAIEMRSPRANASPATGARFLADRQALAGEGRLLDLERRRDADPAVGGHPVARLHQDHVTGHELLGVDLDRLPVATDAGDGLHHLGQGLHALLRLGLLAKADHRVEHGEAGEDDGGGDVAGDDEVDDRGGQKDELHEVLVLPEERLEPRLLLSCGEPVRSVRPPGGVAPRRRSGPARARRRAPAGPTEHRSHANHAGRLRRRPGPFSPLSAGRREGQRPLRARAHLRWPDTDRRK